jgi:site-specific DNA recombinase
VAAVRERVASEGLTVPSAMPFLDEGYSGATLVRPALERLRDVVAARAVDRLSVHSPDRLAHTDAYQVLRVDEFRRAGVEVMFLNRARGQSPEDDLVWSKYSNSSSDRRLHLSHRPRFDLSSAPLSPILSVTIDGKA